MTWSVDDRTLYHPDHLVVRHLYDSDHMALVWFGFMSGQSLRDHQTSSEAVIQVLKGEIRLVTASEQRLQAGQAVKLEPNQRHALTATQEALVQLILVPHPRCHSLAKELDLPLQD